MHGYKLGNTLEYNGSCASRGILLSVVSLMWMRKSVIGVSIMLSPAPKVCFGAAIRCIFAYNTFSTYEEKTNPSIENLIRR